MANNTYVNKVSFVENGTPRTLIDLTADTVTAADVAQGKTFHLPSGAPATGTATGGGGGGSVYQDAQGYLVLDDEGGGSSVTVEALSVTANGTYTAPTGTAYSPVTVNVSGGGGGSDFELIGSDEIVVSTTSTTATVVKSYTLTNIGNISDSFLICLITDKAGVRSGHFYSSVTIRYDVMSTARVWTTRYNDSGVQGFASSNYGVYITSMAFTMDNGGTLSASITARYDETNSRTIDGTFSVKFYRVPLASLR